jgi:hypothetical protein
VRIQLKPQAFGHWQVWANLGYNHMQPAAALLAEVDNAAAGAAAGSPASDATRLRLLQTAAEDACL